MALKTPMMNVLRSQNARRLPASFLLPCAQRQCQFAPSSIRAASILSSLSDNQGAYHKRIRRGRGPSSGKGKTSGRGHKGQKQHGKVPVGFQGGQTPIEVVKGTRGFNHTMAEEFTTLNLDKLQEWIDHGRLDPSKPITVKELMDSRCVNRVGSGVKVLGRGSEQLKTPIRLLVSRISASAVRAIEGVGGTVMTRYYSPFSIRQISEDKVDAGGSLLLSEVELAERAEIEKAAASPTRLTYSLVEPKSRPDIEYYRDPAHRGYLSHLVAEGQGPSLFFRTPKKENSEEIKERERKAGRSRARAAENRLW